MGCVEEKVKAGGSGFMGGSGAHTTCLLEEMKLLKEMQDQSGLFISIKKKKNPPSFFGFFCCKFW